MSKINLEEMILKSGLSTPGRAEPYVNGLLKASVYEQYGTFTTLESPHGFNPERPFEVFGGKYAKHDRRKRRELRGFADGLVEIGKYGLARTVYEFLGMKDKVKKTEELAKQSETSNRK